MPFSSIPESQFVIPDPESSPPCQKVGSLTPMRLYAISVEWNLFIMIMMWTVKRGWGIRGPNNGNNVPYPGEVLDLSTFDALQIPLDNGSGGMTQIKHPKLDTYTSEYFYTNPSDVSQVVFWAPENGVVSGNGAGPRTELTEANNYFTFSGKHKMKYTMQVKETPHGGKVCIGQIKGDSYGSQFTGVQNVSLGGSTCLIVVELIYEAEKDGLVTAHMRDKKGGDCSGVTYELGKFKLDENIDISMEVDGYDVFVSSNKVSSVLHDYSFWKGEHYGMHFKVGVYDQNKNGSRGGKAKLSNLKISHSSNA